MSTDESSDQTKLIQQQVEKVYNAMDGEIDSSADETNNLVMDDDSSDGNTRRKKKYIISGEGAGASRIFYKCSIKQWLLIVLVSMATATVLCLLVGVGIGLGVDNGSKASSSSSSDSDLWKNVRLPSSIIPEG